MSDSKGMKNPETRKRLVWLIEDFLTDLTQEQKKVFVGKHYCGWQKPKIAGNLRCSQADVERMLRDADVALLQRIRSLVFDGPDLEGLNQLTVRSSEPPTLARLPITLVPPI